MIYLADDGTLDTVLECGKCGEQLRYNFACSEGDDEGEDAYDNFVDECINDAVADHECN